MIRKGDPWERRGERAADVRVEGDDAALAAMVTQHLGALVDYAPTDGDLARALGLGGPRRGIEVSLDAIRWSGSSTAPASGPSTAPAFGGFAVNAIVVGSAPDRQRWITRSRAVVVRVDGRPWLERPVTGVLIANGQFLRGHDAVPRGHPGDGRLEVHAYCLPRRERSAMRRRLVSGTHVPHPGIETATGRTVTVRAPHAVALEVDGRRLERVRSLDLEIVASAFRLRL